MDKIIESDRQYSGDSQSSSQKVEEVLENMIEWSDNESYNELVRMHSANRDFSEGCLEVEQYIEEAGYENTGIFHTLSPSSTEPESTANEENYTCVLDCGILLESIWNGTCVSAEASEKMLDLLLAQQVTEKIPSGIPEGILVANKTGETETVQHDAAIVFGEDTDYILCVMSSEVEGAGSAVSVIQEISSAVYTALNT